MPELTDRPLRLFDDGADTVIAYDEKDAIKAWEDHTGDEYGGDEQSWQEPSDSTRLTIIWDHLDGDDREEIQLTVREWIERMGRGFLASTEE